MSPPSPSSTSRPRPGRAQPVDGLDRVRAGRRIDRDLQVLVASAMLASRPSDGGSAAARRRPRVNVAQPKPAISPVSNSTRRSGAATSRSRAVRPCLAEREEALANFAEIAGGLAGPGLVQHDVVQPVGGLGFGDRERVIVRPANSVPRTRSSTQRTFWPVTIAAYASPLISPTSWVGRALPLAVDDHAPVRRPER